MRSLVGPVPEPAERASSALRRCPRATLTFGSATPAVALVHQSPGTADLSLVIPIADAASIGFGGVTARLEVLDEIIGAIAVAVIGGVAFGFVPRASLAQPKRPMTPGAKRKAARKK